MPEPRIRKEGKHSAEKLFNWVSLERKRGPFRTSNYAGAERGTYAQLRGGESPAKLLKF